MAEDPPVSGQVAEAQEEAVHGEGAAAHGESHEHAHIGAEGVSKAPEEFKSDLAIYSFVIFLLLLAILGKFAWGPITKGLDAREERIAAEIAAAHKANDDAKQLLAQYEVRLTQAQDEVRAILDEARRDADHTAQEIVAKAKADAASEMARGKREIETATSQALKEIAESSANLAVQLAGRIIRTNLADRDHSRLIEEAMASLPGGSGPSRN
jgi:F-type H+-transporting ATPase subunit b